MKILFDKCPICGGSESEVLLTFKNSMRFLFDDFRPVTLQKQICKQCAHIFCDRYHTFEDLQNHYQNARDSAENLIYNENDNLDELFTNLAQWFYESTRMKEPQSRIENILDLGCGKCDLLESFGEVYAKAELHGVDFSPQSLSYGRKKGIENIFVGNFLEQQFDGLNFDLISATGILEHQIDLDSFLRKIISLCHEGTYLLIEVPDSHAIIKERPDLKAKYMHDICNDEHVHHFNLSNLESLLGQYNFSLVDYRTIQRGDWQALDAIYQYQERDSNGSASAPLPATNSSLEDDIWKIFTQKRSRYLEKFHERIARYQNLGIYGAGWHTSILLPAFFEMPFERIKVIFDQDSRKVNKELFGATICYPEKELIQELDAVLISSINMEESIFDYLVDLGISSTRIIRLYEALDE